MNSGALQWKWVGVSLIIFTVVQVILNLVYPLLVVATLGIGLILWWIIKPLGYFIGGYLTGFFSPGITLLEPAVGAVLTVVIGSFIRTGHHRPGLLWIILSGVAAFVTALIGAKLGEKHQAGSK